MVKAASLPAMKPDPNRDSPDWSAYVLGKTSLKISPWQVLANNNHGPVK